MFECQFPFINIPRFTYIRCFFHIYKHKVKSCDMYTFKVDTCTGSVINLKITIIKVFEYLLPLSADELRPSFLKCEGGTGVTKQQWERNR